MSLATLDYSGIVATTYDLLVTNDAIGDAGYFRDIIRDHGEPALEIGCGTGRLLLDCVAEGLDVEGVDSSPEMLQICRHKAEQRGRKAAVHAQAKQRRERPTRFRTLFVPAGSFMLLLDPADAERALARFHAHLAPGGQVLVALEQPADAAEPGRARRDAGWRPRRQAVRREDGATIECWERVRDDPGRQIRASAIRYTVRLGDRTIERPEAVQTTRWYSPHQFCRLLERAGFAETAAPSGYTARRAEPGDAAFVCVGRDLSAQPVSLVRPSRSRAETTAR